MLFIKTKCTLHRVANQTLKTQKMCFRYSDVVPYQEQSPKNAKGHKPKLFKSQKHGLCLLAL